MNFKTAFVALVLSAVSVACGANPEFSTDPADEAVAESTESLSKAALVGTYEGAGEGWLESLELHKDGTFAASQIVTCVRAPCDPIQVAGRWTSTQKSIALTQEGVTRRFAYTSYRGHLRLYENGTLYAHLVKSKVDACAAVRCASGTECKVQANGTAACVSTVDACATVRCMAGTTCQVNQDGAPQCVAN